MMMMIIIIFIIMMIHCWFLMRHLMPHKNVCVGVWFSHYAKHILS